MIAVSNILPLPNPPLIKAIVYTQVKLPPLIPLNPPDALGENQKN